MPELPIVVDANNWGGFILGLMLLGAAAFVVQRAWQVHGKARVAVLAVALVMLVEGAVMTETVGWRLRIGQKGVAWHSPLDLLSRGGEIDWPDLTAVEIVRLHRGVTYGLSFRGARDVDLVVPGADRLPPQFIMQLQTVVAKFAPQITDIQSLQGRVQSAHQSSDTLIGNSFSAHDGRGTPLR